MAGRSAGFRHSDAVREKIRTGNLIDRLMRNAEADQEFMTANQIRCAEILLRKSVPDLQAVTHSGDPDSPVKIEIVTGVTRPAD